MYYQQMFIEYILIYCTSRGLTAIGEPAPSTIYQPADSSIRQCSRINHDPNADCKSPMPVWIISIFLLLATSKWMISFLIWYLYLVASTVTAISTTRISLSAVLTATPHETSHRARLLRLARQIKVIGAFKKGLARHPSPSLTIHTSSVLETRQSLTRRETDPRPFPQPLSKRTTATKPLTSPRLSLSTSLYRKLTTHPAFRGLAAYLTLLIPQWYLAHLTDICLSGLPPTHIPGYGTTSIVLATAFGGGFAVWTHYCITLPSARNATLSHFPRGHEVLTELWPVTAFWQVCEHLCLSIPLALSRWFRLSTVAFDGAAWNGMQIHEQWWWVARLALVAGVHAGLVAGIGLPAMMVARRFYASMLSAEDLAIVPLVRKGPKREAEEKKWKEEKRKQKLQSEGKHGNDSGVNTTTTTSSDDYTYAHRTKLRKPGLTVSEAWATITLPQYLRVLAVYAAWAAVTQAVQLGYWWMNWELHSRLGVERFSGNTKLPGGMVGVVEPVLFGGGGGGWGGAGKGEGRSEL